MKPERMDIYKCRAGQLATALLLFATLLTAALLTSCGRQGQDGQEGTEGEMPNFIFIALDDLNIYNTLLGNMPGNFLEMVYPDPETRSGVIERLTPHIEELADESFTFTSAFCPFPLCGPSRTALFTGVPPHVSGYYFHDKAFRGYETLTDAVTLPQYLKDNGYYTSGIGKVFHKSYAYLDRGYFSDWPDRLYSWDDWVEVYTGTGRSHESDVQFEEYISEYWPDTDDPGRRYTRFGVTTVPREESKDYRNARHISDLILHGRSVIKNMHGQTREITVPEDKPYFLACGLFAPHLPWVVPQEFHDLFPRSEMAISGQLMEWVQTDLEDLSASGKRMTSRTGFTRLVERGLEVEGEGGDVHAWKAYFQAYLATVAYSDRNVGLLLDAIRRNPERENTVVILWSDHGYHVGDKNRTGKTTLWEAANHCNLVIHLPWAEEKGVEIDRPVSLQELYPTLVALAGLSRPSHIHGYDLTPLLQDPSIRWEMPVLNTNGEGDHALRTGEYRYLKYSNGDQELYDLKEDPFEYRNLAGEMACHSVLDSLDAMLETTLERKPQEYMRPGSSEEVQP